jgi:dTDP-4-dehydrorhamnose reductase
LKIVLLGKNGQVGSNILKKNKDYLFNLFSFSRRELDISNFQDFESKINIIKPDVIVNATAYNFVDLAEENETEAFKVNQDALDFISTFCNKLNIPLIHISTDFVFDGNSSQPYKEDDKVNPLNIYGKSKVGGEDVIKKNLDKYIIIRTSWVFSEIGSNFLKTILKLLETKKSISIVNNQIGSPTSANSISDIIMKILKIYSSNKSLKWGTYHFSGYPYCSWYEFANEISSQYLKFSGSLNCASLVPIDSKLYNSKALRPKNSRLNCSKINKIFGFKQDDWKESLNVIIRNIYEK